MVRLGQLFQLLGICSMKTVACLPDVKGTGDAPVGERVNGVLVVRFILYCTGWQWLGQVNRALLKNVDFFMEGYSAQCAFWVVRWPCSQKAVAAKTLSHGKTILLRLFFLCSFRKKI